MSVGKEIATKFKQQALELVGEITSQTKALECIEYANNTYIQARYGCSERWLRLSKREARYLVQGSIEAEGNFDSDLNLWLG